MNFQLLLNKQLKQADKGNDLNHILMKHLLIIIGCSKAAEKGMSMSWHIGQLSTENLLENAATLSRGW